MKLWQKNVLLLVLVVALVLIPLIFVPGAEFSGADGQAENLVTEISPDYEPWFSSFFEPASGEIESLLFALQAALGAGIIGFGFGRLSARKKKENDSD